jgi:hypothetical protein
MLKRQKTYVRFAFSVDGFFVFELPERSHNFSSSSTPFREIKLECLSAGFFSVLSNIHKYEMNDLNKTKFETSALAYSASMLATKKKGLLKFIPVAIVVKLFFIANDKETK